MTSRRRALLWLTGLAALLGDGRGSRPASAQDGQPLIAGQDNLSWSLTTLEATLASGAAAWTVQQVADGATGIEARGREGVQCDGGRNSADGQAGAGLLATGGQAVFPGPQSAGGRGLYALGGDGSERGGDGIEATGGAADGGQAGVGLNATGMGATRASDLAGEGLQAYGGTVGGDGAPGGVGVYATAQGSPAVVGFANSASSPAILGENSGQGIGVYGRSGGGRNGTNAGVAGSSGRGNGGQFQSDSGRAIVGVSEGGAGLRGESVSGVGIAGRTEGLFGVVGVSTSGWAAAGRSASRHGGRFETSRLDQYALAVMNLQAAGPAGNGARGLLVDGDFVVTNAPKAAAVPTSQGTRLLYAVEGPVALFEDFGVGQLEAGSARITLDPIFAQTIELDDYQVMVTPRSPESKGLAVVAREAAGFTVREARGGAGRYAFDFRIVGRRKGLTAGHRLAGSTPLDLARGTGEARPAESGPDEPA